MKPRFALALLGLLLATASVAQPTRLVAFGDSITLGFGDAGATCDVPTAGYPLRLPGVLQAEGQTVVVINEGICFETTSGGVSRIDNVLDIQGGAGVILMEGTNDISMGNVSMNTMRFNLSEMARKAEDRGIVPLTLSPIPRGPGAGNDVNNIRTRTLAGWLEFDSEANNRLYEDTFTNLIDRTNLFGTYYTDAFHLNSDGYDLLTQIIAAPILDVLEPDPDPDPDPPPFELMCPAEPNTTTCVASDRALCAQDDRFRLEVTWRKANGMTGAGHAASLTADTGDFWFFDSENIELIVKVLDGRPSNGHFWVFYGALSNVEYRMRVTDTETGACRVYSNPPGTFASVGDTMAFAAPASLGVEPSVATARSFPQPMLKGTTCVPSAQVLCLGGGRFQFTVSWQRPQGPSMSGTAVVLTEDTGTFWFAESSNIELVVKLLDGSTNNGHFWVFYGALSNLAYTMTVADLETGRVRVYTNPAGTFASVGDTLAFPNTQP